MVLVVESHEFDVELADCVRVALFVLSQEAGPAPDMSTKRARDNTKTIKF